MRRSATFRRARQGVALGLIVIGGALMLLSPSVKWGLVAFGLGLLLELLAQALERRRPR